MVIKIKKKVQPQESVETNYRHDLEANEKE